MKLKNKTVLVTGGSRGIGKAVSTRLAKEGASIAINYREKSAEAEALKKELETYGVRAKAFQADVSDPRECQSLVNKVVVEFGRLDILVSNAGVEHFGKLEEITAEDFQRVFQVNVGGQLFMAQAASPHLPKGGRIVLTSSVSAQMSVFHHTLYAASKAAVSAMVLNLAPEFGLRGITINAIAPGGTNTDMAKEAGKYYVHPALREYPEERVMKTMTALQRMAEPEEIAAAVAFLVSDDASYVTGSTLAVDGGMLW